MAANTAHIPLECRICPKKPSFSDISHLLTHVASKSHLSNYYKMKVQGTSDMTCRNNVDDYDDWYASYNIDDLMRERMNAKDRRNSGRSGHNASRRGSGGQSRRQTVKKKTVQADAGSPVPATTASSRSTPIANGRRAVNRPLRDSVLNPQLDSRVKNEPMSRSATPASMFSIEPAAFVPSRFAPPSTWSHSPYAGTPYADSPIKQETLSSSRSDDDDDDSFVLNTVHVPRRGTLAYQRRNNSDSQVSVEAEEELDEMGATTDDPAKLKGVYWPGMMMFDSATSEMKRKRNQKKDYSVIEHLMATSEYVEPTEQIFLADGTLRKERLITGNPDLDDDDSLLSGEIEPSPEPPVKKRAARRPRPALTDKDTNTGRTLRRRPGASHHPGGSHLSAFGKPRAVPYYDGAHGDDDDDLTYGRARQRKRSGPSIHRDNTGPDITFPSHQAPMNYLTAGFAPPLRGPMQANTALSRTPPFFTEGYNNRGHQRFPSLTYPGTSYGNSFRAAPAGINVPNYVGSFGNFNPQSLFQTNTFPQNPRPQSNHNAAAHSWFQSTYGPNSQPPFAQDNMFHTRAPSNDQHTWNMFTSFEQQTAGVQNTMEPNFAPGTELNPLFFSSNHPTPPEDDEATVSPPESVKEREH